MDQEVASVESVYTMNEVKLTQVAGVGVVFKVLVLVLMTLTQP